MGAGIGEGPLQCIDELVGGHGAAGRHAHAVGEADPVEVRTAKVEQTCGG